jgi:kynurenine formamidase
VPGIPAVVWFSRRTTHDEKQAGMMGEGFFSEVFTHVGQWGTHVDPLAHFHKSLRHG